MADHSVDLGIKGLLGAVQIGYGGFADVYRAFQPTFDSYVAVKVFRNLLLDASTPATFERECRAIGRIRGRANILTVYDAGITAFGRPYMIMAYLAGGSLEDRLQRDGPMSWPEAVDIGVKLAKALHVAHEAGVLHRDVKPDNILVSDDGEPLLAEFGIARLTDVTRATQSQLQFTPAHVAPEQLAGDPPTAAVDVYALASTVFQLIVGRPAFVESANESVFRIIRRVEEAPVPNLLRPLQVPEAVCQAIETAMAKDPAERPSSAAAFGALLAAARAEAAVREAAVREAAVREAAVREAAVREAAVREAAVREAAVREAAVREAAVREAAVREAAVREAAVRAEAARAEAARENARKKKLSASPAIPPTRPASPKSQPGRTVAAMCWLAVVPLIVESRRDLPFAAGGFHLYQLYIGVARYPFIGTAAQGVGAVGAVIAAVTTFIRNNTARVAAHLLVMVSCGIVAMVTGWYVARLDRGWPGLPLSMPAITGVVALSGAAITTIIDHGWSCKWRVAANSSSLVACLTSLTMIGIRLAVLGAPFSTVLGANRIYLVQAQVVWKVDVRSAGLYGFAVVAALVQVVLSRTRWQRTRLATSIAASVAALAAAIALKPHNEVLKVVSYGTVVLFMAGAVLTYLAKFRDKSSVS